MPIVKVAQSLWDRVLSRARPQIISGGGMTFVLPDVDEEALLKADPERFWRRWEGCTSFSDHD